MTGTTTGATTGTATGTRAGAGSRTAPGGARWRASVWDYLAIAGWLAAVTALGALARLALAAAGVHAAPTVATFDATAFVLTVLPVWAGLTVAEAGHAQASWGKRRAGLRVIGPGGERPGPGRVALRNAVKLLPWQLAHVAVVRMAFHVDQPVTIAVTDALALALPVVSIAVAWRDGEHRALHDLVAGTRVVRG